MLAVMSHPISIHIGSYHVATLTFREEASALAERGARRTPAGFIVGIPAKLQFLPKGRAPGIAHVARIRVQLQLDDGYGTEIGLALDDRIHAGSEHGNELKTDIELRGTYEALEALEAYRSGQPPKLTIQAWVEGFFAIDVPDFEVAFQSKPEVTYGTTQVTYPRDGWNKILDLLGKRNVLVEIPTSQKVGGQWHEIYKGLTEASQAFDRGGEDGWKASVVASRLALEKWRIFEEPTFGPGWKAPTQTERESWTGMQRMEAVRYWLLQVAHLGPHTFADVWTREDALLVLATLSTLLSVRNV
jgi:hypothetical protein